MLGLGGRMGGKGGVGMRVGDLDGIEGLCEGGDLI